MRVREAMTTQVITATPDDSAWTVAELLTREDLTGLPVVDTGGSVVGVITEQDLIHALRDGRDLRALSVGELASKNPKFVGPDSDLDAAAALLEEWQIRRLPVCADGRLVGIISRGDLLRALMEN